MSGLYFIYYMSGNALHKTWKTYDGTRTAQAKVWSGPQSNSQRGLGSMVFTSGQNTSPAMVTLVLPHRVAWDPMLRWE